MHRIGQLLGSNRSSFTQRRVASQNLKIIKSALTWITKRSSIRILLKSSDRWSGINSSPIPAPPIRRGFTTPGIKC